MVSVNIFWLILMYIVRPLDCNDCNLSADIVSEIRSYENVVKLIAQYVVADQAPLGNLTWTKLAEFVDDFGSRLTGTENLENAIEFLEDEFMNFELDNVHTEEVLAPHWVRNLEYAILRKPRSTMALSMLGIGGSIGTPEAGINASVIVVRSFEELKQYSGIVPGKIVVFNQDFVSYEQAVPYRLKGASEAAKLGAVAVLVRSLTPFSIGSPHTGILEYDENVKAIPAACISVENAQMLGRLYERGIPLEINLFMGALNLPRKISRNLVGEIRGEIEPEKIVMVSGHTDSWDVGQGAMDDGAGAFVSWISLVVMRFLNLQPRRTVRAVLWTAEEQKFVGAQSYLNDHKLDLENFVLTMESDTGTFSPTGLTFFGSPEAACIMEEILKLMAPLNATILERTATPTEPDISVFYEYGIPGAGLRARDPRYFWFHHSEGDSMAVVDPSSLDRCTALWAAVAYIVADLRIELPRATPRLKSKLMYP